MFDCLDKCLLTGLQDEWRQTLTWQKLMLMSAKRPHQRKYRKTRFQRKTKLIQRPQISGEVIQTIQILFTLYYMNWYFFSSIIICIQSKQKIHMHYHKHTWTYNVWIWHNLQKMSEMKRKLVLNTHTNSFIQSYTLHDQTNSVDHYVLVVSSFGLRDNSVNVRECSPS